VSASIIHTDSAVKGCIQLTLTEWPDCLVSAAQGHDAEVTCCSFSPNGSNVATASDDGVVRVWAPASLAHADSSRTAMLQCGASVSSLAWDARAGAACAV
jgi:WD40 repeat protein